MMSPQQIEAVVSVENQVKDWIATGTRLLKELEELKAEQPAKPEPLPLYEVAQNAFEAANEAYYPEYQWAAVVSAVLAAAEERGLLVKPLVVTDELVEQLAILIFSRVTSKNYARWKDEPGLDKNYYRTIVRAVLESLTKK